MDRSIPEDSGAIRSRVIKQTGPRTARGKAASSQNARKHGLRSKDVVIQGERPEDFDDLLRCVREDKNPVGAVEEHLVVQIAGYMWRLERAVRVEASLHAEGRAHVEKFEGRDLDETALALVFYKVGGFFESLSRYETTFQRSLFRALDQLEKLQAARIASLELVGVSAEIESVEAGPAAALDPANTGSASASKSPSAIDLLGELKLD